jgi:hypothetical protein
MPCHDEFDENDEWDGDEDDKSEEGDSGDDDEEATVPCPYCDKPIHEDSERCPYCEKYISAEDAPPARKPVWIVIGAIVALIVIYRWIVP